MDEILLDNISFELDRDALMAQVRLKEEDVSRIQSFKTFMAEASAVSRPKALYRPLYIDEKDNDRTVMGGFVFNSRVLAVNLADVHRVFAFVATCGTELGAWAKEKTGLLEKHWADTLMQAVLFGAGDVMRKHIQDHFNPGKTSFMTPGSLEDWPITEQRALFSVFEDVRESIDVRLTPEFMMKPIYSISGIIFPTEMDFENCMLCPRKACPGRRAPYDKELYEKRYT